MPETNTKYYEMHVFLSRDNGYSRFFKTEEEFEWEEDIIAYALENLEGFDEDAEFVDYAYEISEEEYNDAMGIN